MAEVIAHDDALAWQERNYPTESVQVRVRHDGRTRITVEQCRRRKQDARIFNAMTPWQETAFEAINAGFRAITSDVMQKSGFDLLRVDGQKTPVAADRAVEMARRYRIWAEECKAAGVRVNPILEIIVSATGLRETERMYRMTNGTAKENLYDGLNLYCDIHGMRG